MPVRHCRRRSVLRGALLGTLVALGAVACLDAAVSGGPPQNTGAARAKAPPFAGEANVKVMTFEGTVAEALPAGGYLYLKVASESGAGPASDRWIATLAKPIAVGDRVRVRSFAERAPFASRRLDREFASVLFAVVTSTDAG